MVEVWNWNNVNGSTFTTYSTSAQKPGYHRCPKNQMQKIHCPKSQSINCRLGTRPMGTAQITRKILFQENIISNESSPKAEMPQEEDWKKLQSIKTNTNNRIHSPTQMNYE
jgi:hypothetical protein